MDNYQTTPIQDENSNAGNSHQSKCPVIILVDNINQILNNGEPLNNNIEELDDKSLLNLQQQQDQEGQQQQQPYEYKTFFKLHKMNRGVTRVNIFASYLGSFLSICFFVFINVAQPFILNNLNIPDNQQGDVSGNLTFYNELTILLASHGWGVASDRIGRRYVYSLGMIVAGLGLLAYPFANSLEILTLVRVIFGIGAASLSAMLSAVLGDYVAFQDRGRASGFLGFAAGGGAVLGSLVLLKIPNLLHTTSGISTIKSVQITYAITAGMAFLGAGLLMLFLKKHNPKDYSLQTHSGKNLWRIAKEGITAGKNPVLSLAYASGFIARGDSAIATTFLSLWIYNYALSVNGGSKDEALSSSGTISGIAQTFALFFSLVAGYMMDKLNRVFSLIILSIIGCGGYFMLAFSTDPLSSQFFVGACIIGCAEIGMVVASTSLVAQESPNDVRGSTSGVFSACGCLGILIASKIGGMYFDKWNGFPFFLFGIFSGILILWGVIVFIFTQWDNSLNSENIFKNLALNLVRNNNTNKISTNNINNLNNNSNNNNNNIDDKYPLINQNNDSNEKIE